MDYIWQEADICVGLLCFMTELQVQHRSRARGWFL